MKSWVIVGSRRFYNVSVNEMAFVKIKNPNELNLDLGLSSNEMVTLSSANLSTGVTGRRL